MPTNYREHAKTFNFTFPEYGRSMGSDIVRVSKTMLAMLTEFKADYPRLVHDAIHGAETRGPTQLEIVFYPRGKTWHEHLLEENGL